MSWETPQGTIRGYQFKKCEPVDGSINLRCTTHPIPVGVTITEGSFTKFIYSVAQPFEGTVHYYSVRYCVSLNPCEGTNASAWSETKDTTFKRFLNEWGVLSHSYIKIDWVIPSHHKGSDHDFRLNVPADTGFQINKDVSGVSDLQKCNWDSPPLATTDWVDLGQSFYLVRCKLGTGNADVTVEKRSKKPLNKSKCIGNR